MENFYLQKKEIWQQEYPSISTFKLEINCRKFEKEKGKRLVCNPIKR